VSLLLGYPRTEQGHINLFLIMISGDALFVIGMFTLGAAFWERLKKLFQWQGV
jgi:hypothetical protein